MCKEKGYSWYDDMVDTLIEKDTEYVTNFLDHMPVPSVQVETLRSRFLERMRAIGAMA